MVYKKRGLLIIGILLAVIVLSGCEDVELTGPLGGCLLIDRNHIFGGLTESRGDIASSHLCLKGGYVSCISEWDNKKIIKYCDDEEVTQITDDIKFHYYKLIKGVGAEEVRNKFSGLINSINSLIQYGEFAFPEEKEIMERTYEEGSGSNLVMKKIKEDFESLTQRNILNINELSQLGDAGSNQNQPFILIPCYDKTKNYIIDFRESEVRSDNWPYDYNDVSEAYLCKDLGSDEGDERYKWTKILPFSSSLDKDDDGVPEPFDCDDDDPDEYGNFIKYGGPDPKIICGDDKANTCGIVQYEGDDLTSFDDCKLQEYACENDCLRSGRKCAWIEESEEKGVCCGAGDVDDIGETFVNNDDNPQKFICLNKELTKDSSGNDLSAVWDSNLCKSDDWCWLKAADTSVDFNIYTIQKPGEKAFDIVSNNDDWGVCGEGVFSLSNPSVLGYDHKNFQCYHEGNKWSWAECCSDLGCSNEGTIKARRSGESIYTLPPINSESSSSQYLLDFRNINTDTVNDYVKMYGKNLPDFSGYHFLEFYFKFTEDNVPPYTKLILDVFGQKGPFFSGNVLGNVINRVTFEKEQWMHVQIPISDWKGVRQISLRTYPESVFEVSNLQLTKSALEDNNFCLGANIQDDREENWINNFDYSDDLGLVTGEPACKEELGLTWLDGPEIPSEKRCCGDDANEYYAPEMIEEDEEQPKACWNSQPVGNEPLTNVQYELSYGQGEWNYNYPPVDFSGKYVVDYVTGDGSEGKIYENGPEFSYSDSPKRLHHFNVTKYGLEKISLKDVVGGKAYFYFYKTSGGENNQNLGEYTEATTVSPADLFEGLNDIYIIGEVDKVNKNYQFTQVENEVVSHTCRSSTCQFPLKGSPPYTIKNVFPQKYDLYYVYGAQGKNRILIDQEKTVYSNNGWLEAVNVPLQVIYEDGKFYGCGDTGFLTGVEIENKEFCAEPLKEHFCAPDSGWSSQPLDKVDYEQFPDETPEWRLKWADSIGEEGNQIPANERDALRSIIFGRNLLLNPWLE